MKKLVRLLALVALAAAIMMMSSVAMAACNHPYSSRTMMYDDETHWEVCNDCGEIAWGPIEHYVRCTKPGVCYDCGAPCSGYFVEHWNYHYEYVNYEHIRYCDDCGEEIQRDTMHSYRCTKPDECYDCGFPRPDDVIFLHYSEEYEYIDEYTHRTVCSDCGNVEIEDHGVPCNLKACRYCGSSDIIKDERTTRHAPITLGVYIDEEYHGHYCGTCKKYYFTQKHFRDADDPTRCGWCMREDVIFADDPTETPSDEPTVEPTAEPTVEPTGEPTAGPTVEPTVEPTAEPTVEPTGAPTEAPETPVTPEVTATTVPTPAPTENPEVEESEEPTATPIPVVAGEPTIDSETGKLVIYDEDGEVADFTGFDVFESADFYFENGVLRDDLSGVVMIGDNWYAMDQGRNMKEKMLVSYDGGVFAFANGTIDKTQNGLVTFNGEKFVFAAGQFQPDVYGAWLDPLSGEWVYVWAGQFYPITDLVSYDGAVFYFVDGKLATGFTGTVKDFNGTEFHIVNGQAR